jgi:hypothetical protein
MSVDDTIRELSGTIAQLGLLVVSSSFLFWSKTQTSSFPPLDQGKINEQIGGLSSRVNITLQTFDDSVSGIARDANKMTEQVDQVDIPCPILPDFSELIFLQTIAQIPGSWTFYVLFFSLLVVLLLLSVLILINLVAKIQSICRRLGAESSSWCSGHPFSPHFFHIFLLFLLQDRRRHSFSTIPSPNSQFCTIRLPLATRVQRCP